MAHAGRPYEAVGRCPHADGSVNAEALIFLWRSFALKEIARHDQNDKRPPAPFSAIQSNYWQLLMIDEREDIGYDGLVLTGIGG